MSRKNFVTILILSSVFISSIHPLSAQLLSVDINKTSDEGPKGANKPGYSAWYLGDQTGPNVQSATKFFTNYTYTYDPDTGLPNSTNISLIIPCTIAMTYPAATSTMYLLGKNQSKNGYSTSTDPNVGWRICIDGAFPWWNDNSVHNQPITSGGALNLTISNLPAGPHTITTYHNDPFAPPQDNGTWFTDLTISRCIVSINGVPAFTNLPSVGCTNDNLCSSAFINFTNSYDGQPVTINFDPDHSSPQDFVVLNGFEIDRPFAPGMEAAVVSPLPGDDHAFANNDVPLPNTANSGWLPLQWVAAGFAVSNYVYFGTNLNAVTTATTASPEFKQLSAAIALATNSFVISNLNCVTTYYWRVDQLDIANGATNVVPGTVWSFRTRHLAFPTAEGYGRFSRGGRGGVVIEVTNLNDSGPGSYRAAIGASGPRTVVFKVSGLIRLNGPCVIGNGYLTVAGQTAPGDGICLSGWRSGMGSCSDVIMRFMRNRLGDASQQAMDGIGLGNNNNSIIDHTTISWTMDESSSSRQSGSVGSQSAMNTFQHNIISEPLRHSYHYNDSLRSSTGCTNCYQEHAFAASISGEIASYHHNLIAHSTDRNWSLAGGYDQAQHLAGSLDIRNNVVYNWKGRTTDGGVFRLNYVSNYYKSYPTSPSAQYLLKTDANDPTVGYGNAGLYYMVGNVMNGVSGQPDLFPDNWANNGYQNGTAMQAILQTNAPIYPSYVDSQSASNAYKIVLSDSGCNLQLQDLIDRRVIGEVMDRTTHYIGTNGTPYIINGVFQANSDNVPGFIDKPTDVFDYQSTNASLANYSANAPWGPYATYNVQVDTDHDGLPDWWERIKGLNTNSPSGDFSDANVDLVGDGYTELERYLAWLALPHYDCTNATTLNVDLTQYTRGFTNVGPTYAVFGAAGGSVVLNGRTAQFTPNTGIESLGSFMFKVTDNTGFSYTNSINVHILSDGSVQTAPGTPTNLVAVAGNAQVALSWNSVPGATSYHVWRSTTSGSNYVNIATSAATGYTDSGLPNDTTYYYVVTAFNALGESTNSAEVNATPFLPVPSIPTGLSATAGYGQVTLSWSAASLATGYNLKRSTTSGSGYTTIVSTSSTGFTDTGLTNGTTYYYVVSGTNAAGESANSSETNATPQIPAPTGLSATAGNAQVALSWNASAGAVSYAIKRSTVNGGPYTSIVTNATTTYTNTGLVNNTTYYYVVSALAGNSQSTNSIQVSAIPVGSAAITIVDPPSATAGGSSASTVMTPVKVTIGANCLVVLINNQKETATNGWTVTWNSQSLTGAVVLASGSTGAKSAIYYLYNPTTDGANHNLSVTFTTGATSYRIQYFTLSGVDTTVPPLTGGANAGSTTTETFNISGCPFNGLAALNAVNSQNGSVTTLLTAYGSGTLTATNITGTSPCCSIGYANFIAAGTDTFTATASLASKFSFTAAVFTPAGAVGNTAPTLPAINNRTINVGYNLSITNNATDSDTPAQTLTYNLPTAPTNAALGASNGILNWRPLVTQANTTNPFSVVVTDNGSPSMSATQNFNVVVNPLTNPVATVPILAAGQIGLSISGQAGPDYAVQGSADLVNWNTLFITNPAAMPFTWSTNVDNTAPSQFYRIKVGPPLP